MRPWVAMLGVCAACGSVGGNRQPDAGVPIDSAKQDASTPICDPKGKFDAPMLLEGINTAASEGMPRLAADELELYFYSNQGTGDDVNIYRAQRGNTGQAFGTPAPLGVINTPAPEFTPSVSSDGLTLFFESSRVSGEGSRLYISTRTSRAGEFGVPSELINVNSSTVTDGDAEPFVTANGQELWFTSNRGGGLGGRDIYRARWNGSSFGSVAAVLELNTSVGDNVPMLSLDMLTVYLGSDRPGGQGGRDIWNSHRLSTSDGFPPPTPVAELNSADNDSPGWLSLDNCRIYFSSTRAGTNDIYVATRHPM